MKFYSFKIASTLGVIAALVATALSTNSSSKAEYVRIIVEHTHNRWCTDSNSEVCEVLSPLTRPALQGVVYLYTTSHNRGLFTTFQTRLPCLDIHGFSIFSLHLIRPVLDHHTAACRLPTSWLPMVTPNSTAAQRLRSLDTYDAQS